jgi:hypothetical protein
MVKSLLSMKLFSIDTKIKQYYINNQSYKKNCKKKVQLSSSLIRFSISLYAGNNKKFIIDAE